VTQPPSLRSRLRDGETLLGTFIKSPDPTLAELLAGAGFDLLTVDLEHSSLAAADVEGIVRAAQLHSVPVLARIPPYDLSGAGRLLDMGVVGIQVSDVDSTDMLVAMRAATAYPPRGHRSLVLSHRTALFGRMPANEYLRRAEEELVVVAQIESRAGVEALGDLLHCAAAPDAWFIGPVDLASDLGHPGDHAHPEVQAAYDSVLATLRGAGVRSGAFARDARDARVWMERGATLIALGSDTTMLADAAGQALGEARAAASGDAG
jgi:2-keto-3-deoxy-L-rhamnonate aldolase RhmA